MVSGIGHQIEIQETWVVITALLLLLASVCFRLPASHLFVTQSNVPSLSVPDKFGVVPPLAVADSFLSSPGPAHGMTVTPSSPSLKGCSPLSSFPPLVPVLLAWQSWHSL